MVAGPLLDGRGALDPDVPWDVDEALSPTDVWFRRIARSIGIVVLVVTGSIGIFLGYHAIPTLRHYGFSFFTSWDWQPDLDHVGIQAVFVGTFQVAAVAVFFALPLALATALFITEVAPPRIRAALVSLVDLMAAVPSIIWGLWGAFLIQPHAAYIARWLQTWLGWIPLFDVDTSPHAARVQMSRYTTSTFIAGMAVAAMVLPMACAVMREVFSQTPVGEREAAAALGATRWGEIRTVVLPFGKGGIIGGSMLSLGRALGETISVLLIISPVFTIKWSILQTGGNTISALIATRAGDATSSQLAALLTAGFVLFLITLVINTFASTVIGRSRSGSSTH